MEHRKTSIIISILIFVLTVLLCIIRPFAEYNNILADALYQRPSAVNSKIKIIKIDEKSMAVFGPTSEWTREIPARLVEVLNGNEECRPAIIAFDVMYIGEKDTDSDAYFARVCEESGNVISAANIVYATRVERNEKGDTFVNDRSISQVEYPYNALASASEYGFANTTQDKDGYIRLTQLKVDYAGKEMDSLAYAIYKRYQLEKGFDIQTPLLDDRYETEFTFSGRCGDYEALSLCDVLDGTIDSRVFNDCIVIVGAYAPGLMDSFNVAVQKGTRMYGVEIHANIVEALMEGKFSQPANATLAGVLMGLYAVAFYLIIRKRKILISTLLMVGMIVADLVLSVAIRNCGWTVCVIYLPIMLLAIYVYKIFSQYIIERIRRKKTLNAFKKYVAPQIVDELAHKNNLEIKLGGENRDIAVLFVDIRGFTPLSESLEPEQVVEILNEYLSLTTKSIFDNMGTLDKFVGDATMAVFNAPFDLEDYVFKAVCAAYDIAAGGDAIEKTMMERFGKTVGFGVGVNCGPAVVGNIGCDVRMDYTAIGDTVNTAARLEANAKKGQILISEAVYECVKDRVEVSPVGEIPLKGKSVGVMVYSVHKVEGREGIIDSDNYKKNCK